MIRNVQALRAVAAMLVVIAHLDAMLMLAGFPHGLLAFGTAGVDLFFVVSGFVMVYATSRRPDNTPATFLRDRIVRVAPLYWLMTILLFFFSRYIPALMPATYSSYTDLIKSVFFIPYSKANGEVHPVLFLGWTLNYEMFFYLIFAISMLWKDIVNRVILISVVLFLLVGVGSIIDSRWTVPFFYTRPIMLEFAAGAWIGVAYIKNCRLKSIYAKVIIMLGIAVLLGRFAFWPDGERAWWSGVSATFILSGLLSLDSSRRVMLEILGDASYSLYLIHPFVVIGVTKIAARLHFVDTVIGLICSALIAFTLAALTSLLAYRFLEVPMTTWLKGRLDRRTVPTRAQ